jgi:uncharacterized protein (DUF169 family)
MRTSRDMLLNGENISCPAAKGTLGSTRIERCAVGECLKEFVKEGMFLSEEAAFRALMGIARMGRRPRYILISTHTTSPDAYVFHLSPKDRRGGIGVRCLQHHACLRKLRVEAIRDR